MLPVGELIPGSVMATPAAGATSASRQSAGRKSGRRCTGRAYFPVKRHAVLRGRSGDAVCAERRRVAVEEHPLRKKLALFAVLAVGVAAPVAVPAASAAPVAAACSSSYVAASLPWGQKCLRPGEFCKVGNAAYRRYGFSCPASGHLVRR